MLISSRISEKSQVIFSRRRSLASWLTKGSISTWLSSAV
jgi:hypothetical protein